MKPFPLVLASLVAVVAVGLVGCSSDGSEGSDDAPTTEASAGDTTTTATEGKSHTEATAAELEIWQTDLNEVGCWAGPVDGELGPETEAAIEAFQAAEGLIVDGLLGPATEGALTDAVDAGKTVCTDTTGGSTTTTTTAGGGGTGGSSAELSAASYDKAFSIGSCQSSGENSVTLQGQADGITLQVSATDGSGTLAVSGGTETDGITLNGTISSVQVGDTGDLTVEGTFTAPNFAGEAFTLTGSCA